MSVEIRLGDYWYKELCSRPSSFVYMRENWRFREGEKVFFRNKHTQEILKAKIISVIPNDNLESGPEVTSLHKDGCKLHIIHPIS